MMKWTTTPTTKDPEEYARQLGLTIYEDPLKDGIKGLYIARVRAIFIQPNQHPHMRRWVITHEIGHHITGTQHIDNREKRRAVERMCDRLAAEFLIPIEDLRATAQPDLAAWAYALRVPAGALLTRLRHLTTAERAILNEPTYEYRRKES